MGNLIRKIGQIKVLRKKLEARGHISHNEDKCTYCSLCEKKCPVDAISVAMEGKMWSIDNSVCIRCKTCVLNCPTKALDLKPNM